MDHLHVLLNAFDPWLRQYGYLLLFVAIFVEGMGIPAPGQTLLIGAALLTGEGELNPVWLMPCALLAALLGDNLGYLIGRRGGRRTVLRFGVNPSRLAKLSGFYRRHGIWPVLFSRFFDGARQLGSLLAGTAVMPWPRFFLIDALGAVLWVCVWVLGPIELEGQGARLHWLWSEVDILALGASLAAVLALGVWLRLRHGEA
jgi:membrane protein DedA with SNARE-associated domain